AGGGPALAEDRPPPPGVARAPPGAPRARAQHLQHRRRHRPALPPLLRPAWRGRDGAIHGRPVLLAPGGPLPIRLRARGGPLARLDRPVLGRRAAQHRLAERRAVRAAGGLRVPGRLAHGLVRDRHVRREGPAPLAAGPGRPLRHRVGGARRRPERERVLRAHRAPARDPRRVRGHELDSWGGVPPSGEGAGAAPALGRAGVHALPARAVLRPRRSDGRARRDRAREGPQPAPLLLGGRRARRLAVGAHRPEPAPRQFPGVDHPRGEAGRRRGRGPRRMLCMGDRAWLRRPPAQLHQPQPSPRVAAPAPPDRGAAREDGRRAGARRHPGRAPPRGARHPLPPGRGLGLLLGAPGRGLRSRRALRLSPAPGGAGHKCFEPRCGPQHPAPMRIPTFLPAAAGLALCAAASAQPPADAFVTVSAPVVAFEHARVIDGLGHPGADHQTLIIKGGRISALGADGTVTVPEGALVGDLSGKTVIPGLVMVHEHLYYSSIVQAPFHVNEMDFSFPRLYLAAGGTSMRTCGSVEPYTDLQVKSDIDAGRVPGPKLHLTMPYLDGEGTGISQIRPVPSAAAAARMVDYWADEGFTSAKVYINLPSDIMGPAIAEAHRRGLKVTGHIGKVSYREAEELGIDDLEHGFMAMSDFIAGRKPGDPSNPVGTYRSLEVLNPDGPEAAGLIKALVDRHVAVTSTLAIFE